MSGEKTTERPSETQGTALLDQRNTSVETPLGPQTQTCVTDSDRCARCGQPDSNPDPINGSVHPPDHALVPAKEEGK